MERDRTNPGNGLQGNDAKRKVFTLAEDGPLTPVASICTEIHGDRGYFEDALRGCHTRQRKGAGRFRDGSREEEKLATPVAISWICAL